MGVGAELTSSQEQSLARASSVVRVFPDQAVELANGASADRGSRGNAGGQGVARGGGKDNGKGGSVAIDPPLGLAWDQVRALHARAITGMGVTVAVVDSGWFPQLEVLTDDDDDDGHGHLKLALHYDATADVVRAPDDDSDDFGHGSHVAGIVGGHWDEGSNPYNYTGVAPDSSLYVVKAFDENGQGTYADVIRGIGRVIADREAFGIRVLNLSFGAEPQSYYWDDPLNQAVMEAWRAGNLRRGVGR